MKAELECDHCGCDVTDAEQPGEAWVWWSQPTPKGRILPVDQVGIHCWECHSWMDSSQERMLFDHSLNRFTGKKALPRMHVMLRDYEWTPAAREKLCDIFEQLQLLPTRKP
jgi:hypothetical protein